MSSFDDSSQKNASTDYNSAKFVERAVARNGNSTIHESDNADILPHASAGDQGISMGNYEMAIALLNEERNDFLDEQEETNCKIDKLKKEIRELKHQLASKNSIIIKPQEDKEKLIAEKMEQERENSRKRVSTENYEDNATKIAKVEPEDSYFGQNIRLLLFNLSETASKAQQNNNLEHSIPRGDIELNVAIGTNNVSKHSDVELIGTVQPIEGPRVPNDWTKKLEKLDECVNNSKEQIKVLFPRIPIQNIRLFDEYDELREKFAAEPENGQLFQWVGEKAEALKLLEDILRYTELALFEVKREEFLRRSERNFIIWADGQRSQRMDI